MKMKKTYIKYILIAVFVLAFGALAFAAGESDQSATATEQPAAVAEQPAAVAEQPAPTTDQSAAVTEQSASTDEQSATATEESAAAGEKSTEGGEHGWKLKGFLYQVLNFAILVGLLWFFARKPIADFLKGRTESIHQKIEEARAAREKAEKALAEVNQRLQSKDREIEELVAASVKAGEKERERLIAEGERMAENLLEQARKNIELELDQARASIKAEAVEMAMELAEKSIKDKLGASEQKQLFEEALGKLEGKV
jgi:F-type H+-transporting ATPase subunit b